MSPQGHHCARPSALGRRRGCPHHREGGARPAAAPQDGTVPELPHGQWENGEGTDQPERARGCDSVPGAKQHCLLCPLGAPACYWNKTPASSAPVLWLGLPHPWGPQVLRLEQTGAPEVVCWHPEEAGAATVEGSPPPPSPACPPADPACPGLQEGGAQLGLQASSLLCTFPEPSGLKDAKSGSKPGPRSRASGSTVKTVGQCGPRILRFVEGTLLTSPRDRLQKSQVC